MKKTITLSWLFVFVVLTHLWAAIPQNQITLDLTKPVNPTSFNFVSGKGNWTETYNDADYSYIKFDKMSFSHLIAGAGASYGGYYWDGFTVCSSGDSTNYGSAGSSESWIANQWGCMAGGGIKTDANGVVLKDANGKVVVEKGLPYLLAYWGYYMEASGTHCLQTKFDNGKTYKAVGMYVNNSPWPYYGNLYGDGFSRKLNQEGDYFKLIIHGLDKNLADNGKSVEYILAQFKDGKLTQSPDWEWVDLSALGEIGGMYYTMSTTDADPTYGPNTAVYFCMDKVQVQRSSNVTVTMNATSQKIFMVKKGTTDTLNVGSMSTSGYKYSFTAYPGTYTLSAYQSDGTTSNGTIDLTISNDTVQSFQFYTITTGATNSGWTMGTDYTVSQKVSGRDGTVRTTTLGSSTTANRATFMVYSGDTYFVQLIPNATHATEGFLPYEGSATITGNVSATGAIPMGYNYTITVPSGATLFVGKKYAHYMRFPEISASSVDSTTTVGKKIYTFKLANGQVYNYRISKPGNITYAGTFSMSSSLAALEITAAMLAGDPTTIDHNLLNNSKYNVADIFLNINEKGYLKLNAGDTCQLVNLRTWQATDNITNNYFIEPDFHYTVINTNGVSDNSVVTVDNKGVIRTVGNGTAIVLVNYDAINVKSAFNGPFFGALWPENTGVFVVTVGAASSSGITTNMTLNEVLNAPTTNTNKVAGINVDAELDVFYYPSDKDGYDYTFTPTGVSSVTLAQPIIGTNSTTYSGFGSTGVTANADGSYTVHLINGKSIVKLTSATGGVEYQVLRAKPVSYTITNTTTAGADFHPGDKVTILFNTVYHSCNKLAGVYNMSAKVVYTANGSTVNSTANQYTFAATAAAQTLSATIPASWDVTKTFDFTGGVINVNGFGDPYGGHRGITLSAGKNPNFTAVIRNAYFGALPTISIPVKQSVTTGLVDLQQSTIQVYPNPFVEYLIVKADKAQTLKLFNISGQCLINTTVSEGDNCINVQILPKGSYILQCGNNVVKLVK